METRSASLRAASSSGRFSFRIRDSKESKQQRFLEQQRQQTRSDRTDPHDGLEDYSESEGHSDFDGSCSFSSFNSAGSSFSSGLRDSSIDFQLHGSLTSNHSQSYRQQLRASKPWMKESAMQLTDLNEEDDEDEEDDSKNAGSGSGDRQLRRTVSEQIDRNIYFLKEPNNGVMKAAYYMSQLRSWTLENNGSCRQEIAKAGGIEAVVSTMQMQLKAYEEDADLSNLPDDEELDQVVETANNADGEEDKSIGAIDPDEEDEEENYELYHLRLQQLGTACLANIARERSLCSSVLTLGGMEAVTSAMEKFPRNANLQEKGCDVIGTLSRDQQVRDKLVKDHNAVKVILQAMEDGAPDDIYVQRRGCIALFRLAAAGSASCAVIGKFGAVEVVLHTMRRHASDAKIQRLGCGVLKALSKRVETNKSRIFATKGGLGLSTVLNAMTKHMGDSGVQEEACRLLGHLTICHLERKFAIARSGALEMILSAMKRHVDSEKAAAVQLAGCVALLNLTTKVELAKMANKNGAIQVVRLAAKPHCPRQAKKILTRLRIARYAPIVFVS